MIPPDRLRRGGYLLLVGALVAVLLLGFAVAEAFEVPLLTDPAPVMAGAGAVAALAGVALLAVDVAVPVPASAVMTVHGAGWGVLGGAALSLTGATAGTVLGVAVGRRGRGLVERWTLPRHRRRASALLDRYGTAAVVATRPVPVLAEAVAVVAGASGMSLRRAVLAGGAGNLVPAFAYAAAGASAAASGNALLVFGGVLVLSLLLWAAPAVTGRVRRARPATGSPSSAGPARR